jgi:hypothetical protein
VGESTPSRTQHGRRHLPGHLRRGSPRRDRHPRPRPAGGRDARRALHPAARPSRVRQLRRRPALASARHGTRSALPNGRRPARYGDLAQLCLEGHRRRPSSHTAAAGARDRANTAARRALHPGAARPAGAWLRPRRRGDLAGPVRRPGAE